MTRDVGPNSSERRSPAPWRLSKLKIPLLPARRGAGAAGGGCRGMLSTTGPAKGMGLGSRSLSSSWHLAGLRSQNVPLESTGMGDLGWGIWDGGFGARGNGKRGWGSFHPASISQPRAPPPGWGLSGDGAAEEGGADSPKAGSTSPDDPDPVTLASWAR